MRELTLTQRAQTRLQGLNRLVAQQLTTRESAAILGLSERHTWRMLAAYRKEGAAALAQRAQANVIPEKMSPVSEQTPGWERQPSAPTPGSPMIWYEDSELKRRDRELVKAGMERARKLGKHIGRPPVTQRNGFVERLIQVVERIGPGGLSHRQAARELDIGLATLKRLLDAGMPPAVATGTLLYTLLPSAAGRYTS